MATLEQLSFNYKSSRAGKARLALGISGTWLLALKALTCVLLFAGMVLLADQFVVGWLVCGLASLPAMLVGWYEGDLKTLRPLPGSKRIDGVLAGDILGKLPV